MRVTLQGVIACRWWRMAEVNIRVKTWVMNGDILLKNAGVVLHCWLPDPFWNFLHRSERQMRIWVADMLPRILSFTTIARGHPPWDRKMRRKRNKWGVGLLLYNLRCLMIHKSWGERETRRFTILRTMNKEFKLFFEEVKAHMPLKNFKAKVKEVINKVLNWFIKLHI